MEQELDAKEGLKPDRGRSRGRPPSRQDTRDAGVDSIPTPGKARGRFAPRSRPRFPRPRRPRRAACSLALAPARPALPACRYSDIENNPPLFGNDLFRLGIETNIGFVMHCPPGVRPAHGRAPGSIPPGTASRAWLHEAGFAVFALRVTIPDAGRRCAPPDGRADARRWFFWGQRGPPPSRNLQRKPSGARSLFGTGRVAGATPINRCTGRGAAGGSFHVMEQRSMRAAAARSDRLGASRDASQVPGEEFCSHCGRSVQFVG